MVSPFPVLAQVYRSGWGFPGSPLQFSGAALHAASQAAPWKPEAQATQLVVAPVLLSQAQPGVPSAGSGAQLVFFVAAVVEPVQACAQSAPYFWPEQGAMHCPGTLSSVWKPALQPGHATLPPSALSQVTPSELQWTAASVAAHD